MDLRHPLGSLPLITAVVYLLILGKKTVADPRPLCPGGFDRLPAVKRIVLHPDTLPEHFLSLARTLPELLLSVLAKDRLPILLVVFCVRLLRVIDGFAVCVPVVGKHLLFFYLFKHSVRDLPGGGEYMNMSILFHLVSTSPALRLVLIRLGSIAHFGKVVLKLIDCFFGLFLCQLLRYGNNELLSFSFRFLCGFKLLIFIPELFSFFPFFRATIRQGYMMIYMIFFSGIIKSVVLCFVIFFCAAVIGRLRHGGSLDI